MARFSANLWIAFSDILFVLLIAAVIGSTAIREKMNKVELEHQAELQKAKDEVSRLQSQSDTYKQEATTLRAELEHRFRCVDVAPLLTSLADCVGDTGQTEQLQDDLCSVIFSADRLGFATNSSTPQYPEAVDKVARCVYQSAHAFERSSPQAFQSISAISIDGYTDCQGTAVNNMRLGAERSLALYDRVLDQMTSEEERAYDRSLLSKIAVRSYGLHRPLDDRCRQVGKSDPDRRVSIRVELRPQARSSE